MTTAPESPDYVLQIDMWANTWGHGDTAYLEHARAKYNKFKVEGNFFKLEVKFI